MAIELAKFYYSPLIEAPKNRAYLKGYNRTNFILYKCDEKDFIGKYFFYMIVDPGGFEDYQWYKCSPSEIKYDEDNQILHFYTMSGKHYAFQICNNIEKLEYYINNL